MKKICSTGYLLYKKYILMEYCANQGKLDAIRARLEYLPRRGTGFEDICCHIKLDMFKHLKKALEEENAFL
jgi:hypothetical protein